MVNPVFPPVSAVDPSQPPQGNGLAVAGLVLGICALVLCWFPLLNWVLAILAIIFGAVGIGRANKVGRGKGMAIAGLVCGIVAAVLGVIVIVAAVGRSARF